MYINYLFIYYLLNYIIHLDFKFNYTSNINTNLINGLFIIHPVLIYIYYSLLIFIFILVNTNYRVDDFKKLEFKSNFVLYIYRTFKIANTVIFIAIILGS